MGNLVSHITVLESWYTMLDNTSSLTGNIEGFICNEKEVTDLKLFAQSKGSKILFLLMWVFWPLANISNFNGHLRCCFCVCLFVLSLLCTHSILDIDLGAEN